MAARMILVVTAMWGALGGTAQAGDTAEFRHKANAKTAIAAGGASGLITEALDSTARQDLRPAIPWMSKTIPNSVQEKLRTAYDLAMTRVQEQPECAGLFSALNADGTGSLTKTYYYPADPRLEKKLCRGAAAFTQVGAPQTYVCRGYASLSNDFAAMLLVHEALHHAGLTEYPHDRKAMRSHEINVMVSEACGF
jgi:hypothetical protein